MAELSTALIRHQLELMGFPTAMVRMAIGVSIGEVRNEDLENCMRGHVQILLQPSASALASLGVTKTGRGNPSHDLRRASDEARVDKIGKGRALRTLHPLTTISGPELQPVVVSGPLREPVWAWRRAGQGWVLIIGTDLIGDWVRFRQGDPEAKAPAGKGLWDFDLERPVYLYESQREGDRKYDRHADWWAYILAEEVAEKLACDLLPVLPAAAPGAIVLTGDDDQAYLEKYARQQQILDGLPITYFLHPLTRLTPTLLQSMRERGKVDLGIHPDAIDAPAQYSTIFEEQVSWFAGLVGSHPASVRNHGYLNDGYWGHAAAWLRSGVQFSSNVPGLDGNILTNSLLPSRLVLRGELTPHWNLITAIGDGAKSIGKLSKQQTANLVFDLADDIRGSGLPGVVVLNLHPQNVEEVMELHLAVRDIAREGFRIWNVAQCMAWFESRIDAGAKELPREVTYFLRKADRWWRNRAKASTHQAQDFSAES